MRRSQEVALGSRPYAFKAMQLLSVLAKYTPVKVKLMESRPVKKTLLIIVTSDRGLAGSFNSQVFRVADNFLNNEKQTDHLLVVAVGKKALFYAKKKNLKVTADFHGFGDHIEPEQTKPLSELVINGFLSGEWDKVVAISTNFRTTLKQEVLTRQILPVGLEAIKTAIDEVIPEHGRYSEFKNSPAVSRQLSAISYLLEPSPTELVEQLINHLLVMQLYHLILEANASEHSARMVAMKTASDNAKELSQELTLDYNKARQAGVTKELIEITSAINTLQ